MICEKCNLGSMRISKNPEFGGDDGVLKCDWCGHEHIIITGYSMDGMFTNSTCSQNVLNELCGCNFEVHYD